jgi:hypothetical protein
MTSPSKTPIVDMALEGVVAVTIAEKVYDKERKSVERLVSPIDLF